MKALVLQGGGSRGAIQAGALHSFFEKTGGKDYDIIAGISVGALCAGNLASCGKGADSIGRRVEVHSDLWLNRIKGDHSVYKRRFWGWLAGYWKMSLNTTQPLQGLIEEYIDPTLIRASGRHLRVGVWNASKDKYQEVSESCSCLRNWIRASSAFPLILEPIKINDDWYADGGVRNNIPFHFLKEFESISEIDIFMTSPVDHNDYQRIDLKNSKDMIVRLLEAVTSEVLYNDLVPFMHYLMHHPHCTIRVFAPDFLYDAHPLKFNPSQIKSMYELGYKIQPRMFHEVIG